jgi:hypothetical protein
VDFNVRVVGELESVPFAVVERHVCCCMRVLVV